MTSRKNDIVDIYPEIIDEESGSRFEKLDAGPDTGHGERVPCVIGLDTSLSMNSLYKGVRLIDELNEALPILKEVLINDELANETAEITVITFGGEVQVINKFAKVSELQFPKLIANGNTPGYEAITLGYDLLKNRINELHTQGIQVKAPIFPFFTDGGSNDPENETRAIKHIESERDRIAFFPIGTSTADYRAMQKLEINQPAIELFNLDFAELIAWIGKSIRTASQSRPNQKYLPPSANCFKPMKA